MNSTILNLSLFASAGLTLSFCGFWLAYLNTAKPMGAILLLIGSVFVSIAAMRYLTKNVSAEDRALRHNAMIFQAFLFCFGYVASTLGLFGVFIGMSLLRVIILIILGASLIQASVRTLRRMNQEELQ